MTPAQGRDVTLTVGHCFVEPIRVAGREWVTRRTYVGYGGGLPKGFTEEGNFVVVSETEAKSVSDGGSNLRFKVAPDPLRLHACR